MKGTGAALRPGEMTPAALVFMAALDQASADYQADVARVIVPAKRRYARRLRLARQLMARGGQS